MSGVNSLAASGLNIASLFAGSTKSSGVDISALYNSSGSTGVYSAATVPAALKSAVSNEDQQIAQTAKRADVQRDIAHYEKVLKAAKTIDDVLEDPIARAVLMKANGLGDQVNYIGLAKKALKSDPNDGNSLANKLASSNPNWLNFAKTFDVANNGLSRLRANTSGFTGDWAVTFQQDGKSVTADIVITKSKTGWSATADGAPIGVEVNGDTIKLVMLWEDAGGGAHATSLTGKVGKDGASMSGAQADDGHTIGVSWSATPFYAGAIKDVTDNYVAERRLDMLDQQLPGLGTAVLFKKVAATLNTPVKILGSAIGREVVTTALNIPKQIAIQSIETQEKVIASRMDPKKLADEKYVDQLVQRYLINLNGGQAGVTA